MSKELNFSQTHLCQFPISITSITIPCCSRQKPQSGSWFLPFSHFQPNPPSSPVSSLPRILENSVFYLYFWYRDFSHKSSYSRQLLPLNCHKKVSNFLPLPLNVPQIVEWSFEDVQWDCPACSFLRSFRFLHNILYNFIDLFLLVLSPPLSFMKVGAMLL